MAEHKKLTLDLVKEMGTVSADDYRPWEVYDVLDQNDYGNLGCTNGGIRIPKCTWIHLYHTWSGSTHIYVNHDLQIYYSEDSGD